MKLLESGELKSKFKLDPERKDEEFENFLDVKLPSNKYKVSKVIENGVHQELIDQTSRRQISGDLE